MTEESRTAVVEAAPKPRFAGLVVRCITGFFYVLVFVSALWWGRWPTAVLLSLFAMLAARELFSMLRADGKIPNPVIGIVGAGSFPLVAAAWGVSGLATATMLVALAALGWYVTFLRSRLLDAALTIGGAVYTGLLLAPLVLIRGFAPAPLGAFVAIAVVFSVWANDSFAYVFGSLLGRHKMAPKISPHKSWEGFFAGVAGSVLAWSFVPQFPGIELGYPWAIAAGVLCGGAAVMGDLVESRIKREIGVKDSGHALPGHGGFFDRMDSMLFVVPMAYWMLFLGGVL